MTQTTMLTGMETSAPTADELPGVITFVTLDGEEMTGQLLDARPRSAKVAAWVIPADPAAAKPQGCCLVEDGREIYPAAEQRQRVHENKLGMGWARGYLWEPLRRL